jgi:FIMAH domain
LIFAPGPHTVVVEVTDRADNTSSASVEFNVTVNSEGLLAAVQYMCELGWIERHGICNSLAAKLEAAIASTNRGNLNAAENQLNAFMHELEAQNGKAINQSAYDVLNAGALYVIEHLHD